MRSFLVVWTVFCWFSLSGGTTLTVAAEKKASSITVYPPALFTNCHSVKIRVHCAGNQKNPPQLTDAAGKIIPTQIWRDHSSAGDFIITIDRTPERETYWRIDSGEQRFILPIIEQINIALSFDDGPAQGETAELSASPTYQVLETLANFRHGNADQRRGAAAIFFVLSSPDSFLFDTWAKGETEFGATMLRETAARGHLIGVHWGGGYRKQTTTHPRHAALPSPRRYQENLLEYELQECVDRVEQITGARPEFVRPPLWVYENRQSSALPIYRKLGLKMILTDAKYPDGGYKIISVWIPRKRQIFAKNLRHAFLSGQRNLIISMHDANTQTAGRLPEILQTIKTVFAETDFGSPLTADRLHFAQTASEIRAILESRDFLPSK